MMRLDGMSVQFYGKRNCQPPEELRMLVIPKDRIPIEVINTEETIQPERDAQRNAWDNLWQDDNARQQIQLQQYQNRQQQVNI